MTVFSFILIAAAVVPLLLVALLALASYFDLPVADRLLDAVAVALKGQWILGRGLNMLGGILLVGLGVWGVFHASDTLHRIAAAMLVPFGLWRFWRGLFGR